VRRPAKTVLAIGLLCVLSMPALLSNNVFAHGDAPSTCENRYDATIESMTVNNGTQTFDPMANSGLQVDAKIDAGYDVTFTLRTANQSSQNNTLPGSTWYHHYAFGFGNGVCVDGADPSQDIPITVHVGAISGIPDNYTQSNVEWGSWPEVVQATYGVVWHSSQEQPAEEQQQEGTTEPPDNRQPLTDTARDIDKVPLNNNVGTLISPFIFNNNNNIQPASETTVVQDVAPDTLVMNGTIASLSMAQESLYILSGNWSMTANDTAISDFEANFTMVRSNGLDRQAYSLGNLTAVDSQNVDIDNGTMTIPSMVDVSKNGMTIATRVNVTIAVEKLNVIKISMVGSQAGILGNPIYGVVDALVRTSNGERQVIERGLTDQHLPANSIL
jgi:hypothetical protein